MPGSRSLEADPSLPKVDDTGDQLLKHARVYTLAEKFGLERLKNLASSKIHCVSSTAKGEVAYARYVYEFTTPDDSTIRAPIANFWATRSHTLRREAEEEFRSLCLEFPQFGYDVLSMLSSCPPPIILTFFLFVFDADTTENSPRPGREAQAREDREDAPNDRQRTQAPTPQQCLNTMVVGAVARRLSLLFCYSGELWDRWVGWQILQDRLMYGEKRLIFL